MKKIALLILLTLYNQIASADFWSDLSVVVPGFFNGKIYTPEGQKEIDMERELNQLNNQIAALDKDQLEDAWQNVHAFREKKLYKEFDNYVDKKDASLINYNTLSGMEIQNLYLRSIIYPNIDKEITSMLNNNYTSRSNLNNIISVFFALYKTNAQRAATNEQFLKYTILKYLPTYFTPGSCKFLYPKETKLLIGLKKGTHESFVSDMNKLTKKVLPIIFKDSKWANEEDYKKDIQAMAQTIYDVIYDLAWEQRIVVSRLNVDKAYYPLKDANGEITLVNFLDGTTTRDQQATLTQHTVPLVQQESLPPQILTSDENGYFINTGFHGFFNSKYTNAISPKFTGGLPIVPSSNTTDKNNAAELMACIYAVRKELETNPNPTSSAILDGLENKIILVEFGEFATNTTIPLFYKINSPLTAACKAFINKILLARYSELTQAPDDFDTDASVLIQYMVDNIKSKFRGENSLTIILNIKPEDFSADLNALKIQLPAAQAAPLVTVIPNEFVNPIRRDIAGALDPFGILKTFANSDEITKPITLTSNNTGTSFTGNGHKILATIDAIDPIRAPASRAQYLDAVEKLLAQNIFKNLGLVAASTPSDLAFGPPTDNQKMSLHISLLALGALSAKYVTEQTKVTGLEGDVRNDFNQTANRLLRTIFSWFGVNIPETTDFPNQAYKSIFPNVTVVPQPINATQAAEEVTAEKQAADEAAAKKQNAEETAAKVAAETQATEQAAAKVAVEKQVAEEAAARKAAQVTDNSVALNDALRANYAAGKNNLDGEMVEKLATYIKPFVASEARVEGGLEPVRTELEKEWPNYRFEWLLSKSRYKDVNKAAQNCLEQYRPYPNFQANLDQPWEYYGVAMLTHTDVKGFPTHYCGMMFSSMKK